MNCYVHSEKEANGHCTVCGKPICAGCAVEMQGKLVCRTCLAKEASPGTQTVKDINTAYLLEMLGGFFGFLGIGYLYTNHTNDGILRLIGWFFYNAVAWIGISILTAVTFGIAVFVCAPVQILAQILVPIWSASNLKKKIQSKTNLY